MPWWHERGLRHNYMFYTDPIALADKTDHGLMLVVREPWTWVMEEFRLVRLGLKQAPHPNYPDKYDLFNEYPFMEHLDYNRMLFEKVHGITDRIAQMNVDWAKKYPHQEPWPYCCWPHGCLLNAAIGATLHWDWRAAFEKQLPYWRERRHH